MTRKTTSTVAAESQRLQNAQAEVDQLRAELAAWRAAHGVTPDDLLRKVAAALHESRRLAAASPAGGSDGDTARTRPGSRPPAGAFTPLRRAHDHLETQLVRAIAGWHTALERIDQPKPAGTATTRAASPHRTTPRVRCHIRTCPLRGDWVPAWTVELAGGVLELTVHRTCPECGTPFTGHPGGVVVSESGATGITYNANADSMVGC